MVILSEGKEDYMKPYSLIIFDLDGTLSDPYPGIARSIRYALEKMGRPVPPVEILKLFIGPPLHHSFQEHSLFSREEADEAVQFYRERYTEKGLYENELYPGISELLLSLKEKDCKLGVATSKPIAFAERILSHFQISHIFDYIEGASLDGSYSDKKDIISSVLLHFREYEKKNILMIGDRKYDVIGANHSGIDSAAVLYGYGTEDEFFQTADSSPTYLIRTVEELYSSFGVERKFNIKQRRESDVHSKC